MFAIIIKDLRAYWRKQRARNIQIIYVGALSITLFLMVIELSARGGYNALRLDYGRLIFSTLIVVAFLLLVALSTPISVILSVFEDKQDANFDLILLTPLKNSHILLGKLIVTTLHAVFMPLSCLPLLSLSVYTGGLPLSQIGLSFLIIFVTVATFNLIGILYALVCQREEMAIILSYATICIFMFEPFLIMISAKVFHLNIQSIPVKITKVFSPLYAMLALMDVVNETARFFLPSWLVTLILYILISVTLFYAINQIRFRPNLEISS
ncbi:MAG: ABC transporter permease [Candidatus Poribacteria bacterium]